MRTRCACVYDIGWLWKGVHGTLHRFIVWESWGHAVEGGGSEWGQGGYRFGVWTSLPEERAWRALKLEIYLLSSLIAPRDQTSLTGTFANLNRWEMAIDCIWKEHEGSSQVRIACFISEIAHQFWQKHARGFTFIRNNLHQSLKKSINRETLNSLHDHSIKCVVRYILKYFLKFNHPIKFNFPPTPSAMLLS